MFSGPILEIDLDKIRFNSLAVVEKSEECGMEVLGVTKGFSAIPQIVMAMHEGGISSFADARLENIISLRDKGFNHEFTLIRIPRLSRAKHVVYHTDASVNSEMLTIKALAKAGLEMGKTHKVILMVDVGDLREGVLPEEVLSTAKKISKLKGVSLIGIGTNMGCYGGILPSLDNLGLLRDIAKEIEKELGIRLDVVSGGGTSTLKLIEERKVPAGINQIRVGEGILLGTDTTHNRVIPWLYQDAFLLKAEIIEIKYKPSVPVGKIGRDAFGNIPKFVDRGIRKRAIVAIGKQDVLPDGIVPIDPQMVVLGASSDHLIVDVTDSMEDVRIGGDLAFYIKYSGLLSLTSSRYVHISFKEESAWSKRYLPMNQLSLRV